MTAVAIVLAVTAAGCFAVAARLQHGAVHSTAAMRPVRLTVAAGLVCQPRWLLGLGLLAAGAGLHGTALVLAPLAVVQPVGVLALPIAVVLGARAAGMRLDRAGAAGAAGATIGVTAFVALTAGSAVAAPLAPYTEIRAGVLVAATVLLLGLLGVLAPRRLCCLAFAAAAGVSFGFVSVLLRAASQRLQAGDGNGLDVGFVLGAGSAILVGLIVGGYFVQLAYSWGTPELVIGSLTVVDPLVAVGLGIGLLGEGARTTGWTGVAELVCAAVAVIGVLVLARQHPDAPPAPRVPEMIGETCDAHADRARS